MANRPLAISAASFFSLVSAGAFTKPRRCRGARAERGGDQGDRVGPPGGGWALAGGPPKTTA